MFGRKKSEVKESNVGIIVIIASMILLGVGFGLFISMPKESGFKDDKPDYNQENTQNNNQENIENNNQENTENNNQETDNPTPKIEVDVDEIISPFLLFKSCGGADYLDSSVTYDSLENNTKLEIAYYKLMKNINQSGYTHEFNISDYLEAYKEVFGSNKEIDFPDQLNINFAFATYSKNDDKYVLEGQGGGCIGINEYETKIKNYNQEENSLEIIVDYGYITTVSDSVDDFETAECAFYNSKNKTKTIKQGFTFSQEDSVIEEIFNNNQSDYLVYTFKLDNGNYVFDNLKIVNR